VRSPEPQRRRSEYQSILSPPAALLDRMANADPGQRVRSVPIGDLSNRSKFASNIGAINAVFRAWCLLPI
jgi:hypothetical protein